MSETETTGKGAGELVFPDGNVIITRGVKASTNLAVGDPITFDTNGFVLKASDTVGNRSDGLGVAIEEKDNTTGADGDLEIQVVLPKSFVYHTAGAAIKPFKLVKLNSSNKSVLHTNPADAALNAIFSDTEVEAAIDLVRDYYGVAFGRYFGHEKEEKAPTDAALDDVIVLHLGVD